MTIGNKRNLVIIILVAAAGEDRQQIKKVQKTMNTGIDPVKHLRTGNALCFSVMQLQWKGE